MERKNLRTIKQILLLEVDPIEVCEPGSAGKSSLLIVNSDEVSGVGCLTIPTEKW